MTLALSGYAEDVTYTSPAITSNDKLSMTESFSLKWGDVTWTIAQKSFGTALHAQRNGTTSFTFGAAKNDKQFKNVTFSATAPFAGKVIKSAKVKCYAKASGATVSLKVDDKVVGEAQNIGTSTSGEEYSWDNLNAACISETGSFAISFDAATTTPTTLNVMSISVTYGEGGDPAKQPADLSFGEKTAFTIALGEEFTEAPTLVNPYNLPVTYASSNEAVAMVDDKTGEVVLMDGVGTTTISAEFAGDETYNPQTVSYTLTVEKQYNSIADILTANNNSLVKINFPMTVAFVNGSNIFATDDKGGFIQIYNSNSYKANDVIPAGWSATYTLYKDVTPELTNATLPESTETKEFVPEAVNFKDLTVAKDINKVVLLKNVVFATATPSTQTNFSGTINGETVDLRNNYTLKSVDAGVYDVTVVVTAFNGNVSLYVAKYAAVPAPAAPEVKINGDTVSDNANVNDGKLTFEVPEGIAVYYRIDPNNTPSGDDPVNAPAKAAPATMDNDGKVYTLYTGEVKLESGSHTVSYFAYDEATGLKSEVKTINVSNTTGIEGIAVEDGAAEWFNLQGVRVAEPQQGIYVRVANGKAAKVVVE